MYYVKSVPKPNEVGISKIKCLLLYVQESKSWRWLIKSDSTLVVEIGFKARLQTKGKAILLWPCPTPSFRVVTCLNITYRITLYTGILYHYVPACLWSSRSSDLLCRETYMQAYTHTFGYVPWMCIMHAHINTTQNSIPRFTF